MSIGVWQVIILLLVGGVVIAIPWVAIWTENTERRVGRRRFVAWMLAILFFAFISDVALKLPSKDADLVSMSTILLVLAGSVVLQFAFSRVIVQRTRDTGHRKRLAYLALIPVINLVLAAYLAFKGSAPAGVST